MRLLNATTINLQEFQEGSIPRYAILSHTWGSDEVSFQDIQRPNATMKAGYAKIQFACAEALNEGLQYVWVDTCCIDKTSSAELSEAINSMFQWYADSRVCFAYLADVPDANITHLESAHAILSKSRWFTRGWTLQELLAPKTVKFFAANGSLLGDRSSESFLKTISDITGIDEKFLRGGTFVKTASVAKRMSWASRRQTTRREDIAYCLMGLFDINMPLLYGEGSNAFMRLQEEIIKNSDDHSIFAWGYSTSENHKFSSMSGLFASHPHAFKHSSDFIPDELKAHTAPYSMTNRGLQISFQIIRQPRHLAILSCRPHNEFHSLVAIPIFELQDGNLARVGMWECETISRDEIQDTATTAPRYFSRKIHRTVHPLQRSPSRQPSFVIRKLPRRESGLRIWQSHPDRTWEGNQRLLRPSTTEPTSLRLWRKSGDGFVIVFYPQTRSGQDWSFEIFCEREGVPYTNQELESIRDSVVPYNGITVSVGKQRIIMSTGLTINIVDIELNDVAMAPETL